MKRVHNIQSECTQPKKPKREEISSTSASLGGTMKLAKSLKTSASWGDMMKLSSSFKTLDLTKQFLTSSTISCSDALHVDEEKTRDLTSPGPKSNVFRFIRIQGDTYQPRPRVNYHNYEGDIFLLDLIPRNAAQPILILWRSVIDRMFNGGEFPSCQRCFSYYCQLDSGRSGRVDFRAVVFDGREFSFIKLEWWTAYNDASIRLQKNAPKVNIDRMFTDIGQATDVKEFEDAMNVKGGDLEIWENVDSDGLVNEY